ncbi:MAG: hypothetical protein HYX27_25960 [Acidobacteria bacterium]|nr:hypothetical protein [Acidobacteriota bacterium]
MTWLVQNSVPTQDANQAPEEVAPPHTKVHWLTMLPSVPAFTPLFTYAAGDEQRGVPDSAEGLARKEGAAPVETIIVSVVDRVKPAETESEPEEPERKRDGQTPAAAPVPQIQVLAVPPVEVPVANETQAAVPAAVAKPIEPAPARPAAKAPEQDKGEVIWSADLRVTAPSETVETKAAEQTEVKTAPATAKQWQKDPPDMQQQQQQNPDANGDRDSEPAEKQASNTIGAERPAGGALKPLEALGRRETPLPKADRPEEKTIEAPLHAAIPADGTSHAASAAVENGKATSGGVMAAEAAEPMRPAQVATLQVNVPIPATGDDAASLRLVVTQRGDQVNVRLRSWDAATSPIESSQMQPLLNSLAEKGFAAEGRDPARIGDLSPSSTEVVQEKHVTMPETASRGSDQSPFQSADDRQQRNQERQQQQQTFFLRRLLRNVQAQDFSLQTILEADGASTSQGARK